jgi:hypothetical protein
METRSLAIGLVAVVAAFAAAFGLAKSGGSKTETAGAGVKAQSIQVAPPAAVSGVEVGGTLPALKAKPKPAKKAKKKSTAGSNTSAPSTNNSSSNTAPQNSTQQSTPPATNNQPNTSQPSNPKPKSQSEEPISSGGDDG